MHNIPSPRFDDAGLEALLVDLGKTAPRITLEDIEDNIQQEFYFTAHDGVAGAELVKPDDEPMLLITHYALFNLTFCVLVLRNGYTVTGESACASPENFNAEVGRQLARANAVNKVWPLLGFRLRDVLCAEEAQA
jgi:hypothetical protein